MNLQPIRRVALITGAGRGLGRVLAEFLAGQGFYLILTARRAGELAAVAEATRPLAAGVEALPGDVADPAHRHSLVDAARRQGRLDLLINNASTLGVTPLPPLACYNQEDFEQVLEVNLLAPLALIQEALPVLRAARGLVVNLSSDAAVGGYPGWGAYGASKAALDLVSKTLAAELAEEEIGVVSVDPGDMRTEMHQAAYPGEDISDRPLPDITLPFWAWLLAQEPQAVSGRRFQAQAEVWTYEQ
ncbi:MAG TPA: SDR family oxidoreductase [Caldilineaceae bacterium]|nr:SDR family oxidoreductase [Caldilineaceae bacterium]